MATIIPYQPRATVLPMGTSTFSKSPTVIGFSTLASSRQSSKSQLETASIGKADFVDLTAFHWNPPQEFLVLRELLGPKCDDPNSRSVRIAGDRSSGTTCNDKVKPGKGDDKDGDDIDYESDTSDLPPLGDLQTERNKIWNKEQSQPQPQRGLWDPAVTSHEDHKDGGITANVLAEKCGSSI